MKGVITGFDAFSRHPFNPTGEIVKDLQSVSFNESLENFNFSVVQTSYKSVDKWIDENRTTLLESDLIILLGLSELAQNLKLEQQAQNIADCAVPDNDGQVRQQSAIANSGPVSYQTSIDIMQVAQHLKIANEPCTISNDAGNFVCNYLYYRVLNLLLTQEHFNLSPRDRHLAGVKKLIHACQASIADLL